MSRDRPVVTRRGNWWGMACWNGLSERQQEQLLRVGTLEIGYEPGGECERPPTVAIETEQDVAPGPRFFCLPCAIDYLVDLHAPEAQP